MSTVIIYGLHDPRDGALRYVGKAKDPARRLNGHLAWARRGEQTHKATWLRALIADGLKPTVEVIEQTTEECWQGRERFWIDHFRGLGTDLTNTTEGGEGGATWLGRKQPEEARRKRSAALKGHPVSQKAAAVLQKYKFEKGQTPRNKLPLSNEQIRELYIERRMSARQIATSLGVHQKTVLRRLHWLGVTRPPSEAQRGIRLTYRSEHSRLRSHLNLAILTIEQVKEIKRLLSERTPQKEIAERFGVNPSTVSCIKAGKSWSWIN